MWPLASKRARDKHPEASLKGWRAGGATTVTAGQRTPSGALVAKALTDGADEAKSGGMGMGRASRTPRGSPRAIWTELWALRVKFELPCRIFNLPFPPELPPLEKKMRFQFSVLWH